MKSVRNWSFSGLYFLAFGSNTEGYSYLSLLSQNAEKCGPENSEYEHLSGNEEDRQCYLHKYKPLIKTSENLLNEI